MATLSVGSRYPLPPLGAFLEKSQGEWQRLGAQLSVTEYERGAFKVVAIQVEGEGERPRQAVVRRVALLLADAILRDWESRILKNILRHDYPFLTPEEQALLLAEAEKELNQRSHILARRTRIAARLEDYLLQATHLTLEGFLRFRLPDYRQQLEEILARTVDRYLLQKEYDAFVALLREHVETHPVRALQVEIYPGREGRHRVLGLFPAPAEVEGDDSLVSLLVAWNPEGILLHEGPGAEDFAEAAEMLGQIFGPRFHRCPGCRVCLPSPSGKDSSPQA